MVLRRPESPAFLQGPSSARKPGTELPEHTWAEACLLGWVEEGSGSSARHLSLGATFRDPMSRGKQHLSPSGPDTGGSCESTMLLGLGGALGKKSNVWREIRLRGE